MRGRDLAEDLRELKLCCELINQIAPPGVLESSAMLAFSVVKERHGWAIRIDDRMIAPFWSKAVAIREANCLADAIRRHGEFAEVIVEEADMALESAALRLDREKALAGEVTPY